MQGWHLHHSQRPHATRFLTWVRSHPELKPEKVGRFEDEDFNIYFADKIAGKESLTPTTDLLSVDCFTIRYIDTPTRPLLKRTEEVVHTNRVVVYKVRRDILRIPRSAV